MNRKYGKNGVIMKRNKKIMIAGAVAIGILIIGYWIGCHVRFSDNGTSVSIIGGADGPTSVFFAGNLSEGSEQVTEYSMITMDEAKEIFKNDGSYIILDVRRADEFADGHIPGAINLANEDISTTDLELLPDKNQTIYVYCRSGNRSKQAAEKLVAMGYTNVVEFGGILDWTGEVVK